MLRSREWGERGAATAEFAIVLPVLVLLIAVIMAAIAAQGKRVLMQDAAADIARLVARNDDAERASALAAAVVPDAQLEIVARGDLLCAELTATATVIVPMTITVHSCALAGGS